jgi:hypothetical protein
LGKRAKIESIFCPVDRFKTYQDIDFQTVKSLGLIIGTTSKIRFKELYENRDEVLERFSPQRMVPARGSWVDCFDYSAL